jgi:hypothetical protein
MGDKWVSFTVQYVNWVHENDGVRLSLRPVQFCGAVRQIATRAVCRHLQVSDPIRSYRKGRDVGFNDWPPRGLHFVCLMRWQWVEIDETDHNIQAA